MIQIRPLVTRESESPIKVSEIFTHVGRYCLHSALSKIGVLCDRIFRKEASIHHLIPNTINEFQLAFISKALILNSNDHRQIDFNYEGLAKCVNLFNNLYDPLLKPDDNMNDEEKNDAINEFLVRTSNQQFPFQSRLGYLIPRALILFDEIPSGIQNPFINIHQEILKIYGLTPRQVLVIGFSIFASSGKGYFDPYYLINTKSNNLKKYLTEDQVIRLVESLTADYYQLRELFLKEETEDGYQQYAFNPLRTFPIVKTQIAGLVIPIPRFVVERITTGIFYSLADHYRTDHSNPFLEFFGKEIFEVYVGKQLAVNYLNNELLPEFNYMSDGTESKSPDWIVIEGDSAVLIECKTSGLTKRVKSIGDKDELIEDLRKRIVNGIAQMSSFVNNIKSGYVKNERLENIKNFYFIVITYDRIYLTNNPWIRKLIDNELIKREIDISDFQILGVDELEKLIPVLKLGKFKWSELIDSKMADDDWSTHDFDVFLDHFLKSKGINERLDNELLEEKLVSLMREISPDLTLEKK